MEFKDFWNRYTSENIVELSDEVIDIFRKELSEEIYQEYDLGEIVAEFAGHHETAKRFDKIQEFANVLKENHPRLYDENHFYINDALINYNCFQRNSEALQEPVQDFITHSLDYEMLLISFKRLVYYHHLNLANLIIEKKYEEVKQDNNLLAGAEYDLAVVKYYMILEDFCSRDNGETQPLDWDQVQQATAAYGFEFKDNYLEAIKLGLTGDTATYIQNLKENYIHSNKNRISAVATLEMMFLLEMQQNNMAFPVSGTIWANLFEFWEKGRSTSWERYFRITEKEFKDFLGKRSGLYLDYRFEVALLLWGSNYILDFLHDKELVSPESYQTQKAIVENIKRGFMEDHHYSLWEYDFVHDWVPAQGITQEAWQHEKEEFVRSYALEPDERTWDEVNRPNFLRPSLLGGDNYPQPANVGPKIGRNEKVSVKYQDGTIKEEIKYKKVADDLETGKCELI